MFLRQENVVSKGIEFSVGVFSSIHQIPQEILFQSAHQQYSLTLKISTICKELNLIRISVFQPFLRSFFPVIHVLTVYVFATNNQ